MTGKSSGHSIGDLRGIAGFSLQARPSKNTSKSFTTLLGKRATASKNGSGSRKTKRFQ
jgi:hypothetical protein